MFVLFASGRDAGLRRVTVEEVGGGQGRATKIYVSGRPTVIMETSGVRKSVVSSIVFSRFGGIACSPGSQSLSGRRAVRFGDGPTDGQCCRREGGRVTVSLPVSLPSATTCAPSASASAFRRGCSRVSRACACAWNRSRSGSGEKGTRAGVEVYQLCRGLSRVSRGSRHRGQFLGSLFERKRFSSRVTGSGE